MTTTLPAQPALQLGVDHDLCPGCGEPLALRMLLEAIDELGCAQRAIGVVGIGCYTALSPLMDVDVIQALHGRAPSVATGAKRMRPESLVFTLQGDGDMVNEGLQEVLHTAARGERVTCFLLNNGVFGETGGHLTATTVLGYASSIVSASTSRKSIVRSASARWASRRARSRSGSTPST